MIVALACAVVLLVALFAYLAARRTRNDRAARYDYDVIVVGCSIAGPVVAKALSDQNRRVLVLERQLSRPDRIVGELLQPGGIATLRSLGMEACALNCGQTCSGYYTFDGDAPVSLPYGAKSGTGVTFHFGDFVMNLRKYITTHCSTNVNLVEGTVTKVIMDPTRDRAVGVEYVAAQTKERTTATAPLVVMCDGGASSFKADLSHYTPPSQYHSHFVGVILRDAVLPKEGFGHVFMGKGGPILSYRLDPNEVRLLADYASPQLPPPAALAQWLATDVAPCLPASMKDVLLRSISDVSSIRSMPHSHYTQTFPKVRGYVGLGDHNNQRHPLTGAGMTCAMADAVRLVSLLKDIPQMRLYMLQPEIDRSIDDACRRYAQGRWQDTACMNMLSWALYDVFRSSPLRDACFAYFRRGGICVEGPMMLLSGTDRRLHVLIWHYFRVFILNVVAPMSSAERQRQLAECLMFCINPRRWRNLLTIVCRALAVAVPIFVIEFVSLWRCLNPQSTLARSIHQMNNAWRRWAKSAKRGKNSGL